MLLSTIRPFMDPCHSEVLRRIRNQDRPGGHESINLLRHSPLNRFRADLPHPSRALGSSPQPWTDTCKIFHACRLLNGRLAKP